MTRLLAGLSRRNAVREATAGVTLLAIAIPLNIGYAQVAGLPPTAGLYALVVPAVAFALLTSSRQLVAAPDAAAAALVASSLTGMAVAGSEDYVAMASAQAILGAALFALCSVFRLGFLANFLSKPILVGFVSGLALDIMLSQIAKMLGVRLGGDLHFGEELIELVGSLGDANLWAVAVSLGALLLLFVGRRLRPTLPWALVVLVGATAFSGLAGLAGHGVAVVGAVDAGPPRLAVPMLDLATWIALVPSALALTFVTVAEGLLLTRTYAEKRGYATDPNRDLAAFGAANLAAGLSSSFSISSSASRTAAMDQSGSRTQLPAIVLATGTLLILIFGTGLLEDVPLPAIGAIVAVAIFRLIEVVEFRQLWRLSRFEFAVGAACFTGALFVGPIGGIVVAFVLSLVNLAARAANPAIDVLRGEDPHVSLLASAENDGETVPGVVVLRFAAPIFFANAQVLGERIRDATTGAPSEVRAFVLDLEGVSDVDITGAEALVSAREWLAARSISLSYTRVRPGLRERLERLGAWDDTREFPTNRAAVAALRAPQEATRTSR